MGRGREEGEASHRRRMRRSRQAQRGRWRHAFAPSRLLDATPRRPTRACLPACMSACLPACCAAPNSQRAPGRGRPRVVGPAPNLLCPCSPEYGPAGTRSGTTKRRGRATWPCCWWAFRWARCSQAFPSSPCAGGSSVSMARAPSTPASPTGVTATSELIGSRRRHFLPASAGWGAVEPRYLLEEIFFGSLK